jgi:uncharacterized protein (TIGR04255 family)
MTMSSEQVTTKFEPINQRHAIVETVFFCEFDPPLAPPVIERLISLEFDTFLMSELPNFNKIQGFGIELQLNKDVGQSSTQVLNQQNIGFERKRVGDDGQAEWVLRVLADSITVHCLDYTEWDTIWPTAESLLHAVIDKIGATESSVSGLGLKYVDRFIFEGDDNGYHIDLLFNPKSDLITPKSFQAGQRWHSHSGWFEETIPGFKDYECLNQLNIDSAFVQFAASNKQKLLTTIEHTAAIRGVSEELPSFAGTSKDEKTPLNALMNYLHDANKAVLARLLTEQMSQRISLNKKGG